MSLSIFWWGIVLALVFVGLVGTILPMLPGAILIALGAFVYEWFLASPGHELGGWTLAGMIVMVAVSSLVDLLSGLWGAKKYGATRPGMLGGLLGLFVGLFFNLPGLILGPTLGVVLGEMSAGKQWSAAVRVAWGTMIGTAVGMALRLGIGLTMAAWLCFSLWRAQGK